MSLLGAIDVDERSPLLLLGGAVEASTELALFRGLRELANADPDLFAARSEELAYLSDVLSSGSSLRGGRFRPASAVKAAIAIANLGLELAQAETLEVLRSKGIDRLFRRAWHRLHTDVVTNAAVAWLERKAPEAADPRIVSRVAARLEADAAKGAPWRAYAELSMLRGVLDPDVVDGFAGLVDECPSLRGALRGESEFFARPADLARARAFINEACGTGKGSSSGSRRVRAT